MVLHPNGSVDTTFGGTGKVTTDIAAGAADYFRCVTILEDGRILAAGSAGGFSLARYYKARLSVTGSSVVPLGSPASLTAHLLNAAALGYQWMKDGVAIPGATGSTYTIPITRPWHIGDYAVAVTTAYGTSVSSPRALQLTGVPTALWRGLVAYYPFQGNAEDRTDGAAHATVSGAGLTTDRMGTPAMAYDFDGVDDQLTATIPALPAGSTPRTLSLWAKARPDTVRIFSLAEWGLPQDGRAFGLGSASDFYTWTGHTFGNGPGVNTGVTVNPAWHHLCMTYDGINLGIYLDGALKQLAPAAALNTALSALKMGAGVGAGGGGTANWFSGSLDEVRIYNRSFTAIEIQQLYGMDDLDTDSDGIIDRFETGTGIWVSATNTGTNPYGADTDGDGLSDGAEVHNFYCNPVVADTDGDGFEDRFEVITEFDPNMSDSAPGEYSAMRRAREFRFSAATGASYRIEGSPDGQTWTTLETNITGAGRAVIRFYAEEDLGPRYFLRARRNP